MAEEGTAACLRARPVGKTVRVAGKVRVAGTGAATGAVVGWVGMVASWAVDSDMDQWSWSRVWK